MQLSLHEQASSGGSSDRDAVSSRSVPDTSTESSADQVVDIAEIEEQKGLLSTATIFQMKRRWLNKYGCPTLHPQLCDFLNTSIISASKYEHRWWGISGTCVCASYTSAICQELMQTMHIRQRRKGVDGCLGGEPVALARELERAAGGKGDKRVVKIAVRRDKVVQDSIAQASATWRAVTVA